MEPKVSIVIPTFNESSMLRDAIHSLESVDYQPFEIIIVNDASADDTADAIAELSSLYKNIVPIHNQQNLGPSASRNKGIKLASGKYVAFAETDMRADPHWLKNAIKRLEEDDLLGAVGPKGFDLRKRDIIQAIGILIVPHTGWVVSIGFGQKDSKDLSHERPVSVGAVGTIFRKEVLESIRGFDEKLVHNIDDIDLGWRVWLTGYTIVSVPDAIVYHETAKSASRRGKITPTFKSEFHFHKMPRVFIKNYEFKNLVKYLPVLVSVTLLRDLMNLAKGNSVPIKASIAATAWFLRHLADTLEERRMIQTARKRSDKDLMSKVMVSGSFMEIYRRDIRGALHVAKSW